MSSLLSRDVGSVALAICDGLAGSLHERVRKDIVEGYWDDLINIQVDPQAYSSAEAYFSDIASVSFLKKFEPLPTSVDRSKVAVDAFFEAEKACYRTNQRLGRLTHGSFEDHELPITEIVSVIRKEILTLIGPRPPSLLDGRFGPGATYGDRGRLTTIPDKMSSGPTLTRDAWPFLFQWFNTLWGKAVAARSEQLVFVRGNRFTTVPKDCSKDRGICVGPSINLFYQLSLGEQLRIRLRESGLDLDSAQEVHRRVACEASISGTFATIDLSQASDTMSLELVRLLLPNGWFNQLMDLREPFTVVRQGGSDRTYALEKFSAMGNGYTFELETLLFLGVCMGIARLNGVTPEPGRNIHVFGDDILVPTALASDVIAALAYFGFKTNPKKTFVKGPFRESCGGDFFQGVNVRPFFLKEEPDEPHKWIALANGIRRMSLIGDERHPSLFRWDRLRRAWFVAQDNLPSNIRRCRGPSALGDLVVHDDPEFWQTKTRHSIRYFRTWSPDKHRKVPWSHFSPDVTLAGACYGVPWGNGGIIPRNSVISYSERWVPMS